MQEFLEILEQQVDGYRELLEIAKEKQILLILLTVLVQDFEHYVLFMDEPEASLHIEWQQKLISTIRELNPNVQLILTTHSPAVIMEGWLDTVTEVSDISTLKE